jgi:ABC-2 type transport system ATP-binding protein
MTTGTTTIDATAATAAVVARGLRKRFGAVVAVDGIDLDVPRGARFGLIGQNGAGKTTFIKLLLGIARHDAGDVRVLGGDPDDVAVRRRIGYLPERLAIPPSFSALAFLDGVARLKGVPAARRRDEVRDCLTLVGLDEDAWGRRTGGYSKGMRQRTGLAAALIGRPDLLVLDEPTDGIDPLGRRQVRDVILEAARRGATLFLNSHLLAETERVCDHVAILHRGRVVRAGPLSVLQRRDAWRVVFARTTFAEGDAATRATAAGFVVANDEGDDADRERLSTSFLGTDATALSAALQRALSAGLLVVSVTPELVELEALLEQSTRAAPDGGPTTTTKDTTNATTTGAP